MASYACSFFFLFGHSDTLLFWCSGHILSISEKPTFCDENTDFSQKWLLKNKRRNSIRWRVTNTWVLLLIGWSKFPLRHDQSELLPRSEQWRAISTYGIFAFAPQTPIRWESRVELSKCRLFSHARTAHMHCTLNARSRRKQLVLFSRESLSYPRRSILIYS